MHTKIVSVKGVQTVVPCTEEEELDIIARMPTVVQLSLENLERMEKEIGKLANEKVDGHIAPEEKAHWMGVADAFARQHNLWLAEIMKASIEQRTADEVTFPPLSAEDQTTWDNLAIIQKLTAAIRAAAVGIATELYQMTDEQINGLPGDWVLTHILWP